MTSFAQNALLQTIRLPSIQFVRFRRRINIQRPAKPHFERARVLNVCTPKFINPKKYLSMPELCQKLSDKSRKREDEENPFKTLLGRELLNWFNNSQMVMIFHTNPIKADELFKARILFRKQNMNLRSYSRQVAQPALQGTKYEALLSLYTTPISLAFSPEPQVAMTIKINRKIPQLILLGGIVDGRLLSKNELVQYSQLPDIQTARAQLVATLNSAASQVVRNITHHQRTLVEHLKQHVELQTSKDKEET